MSDQVKAFYDGSAAVLDANLPKEERDNGYQQVLASAKGEKDVKIMAVKFIAKHAKDFPEQAEASLNTVFDMCEDDLVEVRINGVKCLPQMCQDEKSHVIKVADVLGQLLLVNDDNEIAAVRNAFLEIFPIDPKSCFTALFTLLSSGEPELKEVVLKFIHLLQQKRKNVVFKDYKGVLEEAKKFITPQASNDDWTNMMTVLRKFGLMTKMSAEEKKELCQSIESRAELGNPFQPENSEFISRFLKLAPLLRQVAGNIDSNFCDPFAKYAAMEVMPALDKIEDSARLDMLRGLCFIVPRSDSTYARRFLPEVFARMATRIPADSTEIISESNVLELECLLSAFGAAGSKVPGATNPLIGASHQTSKPSEFPSNAAALIEDWQKKLSNLIAVVLAFKKKVHATEEAPAEEESDADKKRKQEKKKQILNAATNVVGLAQYFQKNKKTPFLNGNRPNVDYSWLHPNHGGPGGKQQHGNKNGNQEQGGKRKRSDSQSGQQHGNQGNSRHNKNNNNNNNNNNKGQQKNFHKKRRNRY